MHTSITKPGHIYAALLLAMPAISAAQSRAWSNIVEYTPPTPNAEADGITAGPDGNLWFTEFTGNNVGRITTAGVITEYPLPQPNSGPFLITAGPDSALWFAEQNADQIGRLTTAGSLTQYRCPRRPANRLTSRRARMAPCGSRSARATRLCASLPRAA
jgi:streptogramin lyase